ncbi:hypothetical protein I7I48_10010 [Histoplasma ohiense]|nr:hypothetical protein I7I48_10010 [Histoplasma ohiense (nom. inval.)]
MDYLLGKRKRVVCPIPTPSFIYQTLLFAPFAFLFQFDACGPDGEECISFLFLFLLFVECRPGLLLQNRVVTLPLHPFTFSPLHRFDDGSWKLSGFMLIRHSLARHPLSCTSVCTPSNIRMCVKPISLMNSSLVCSESVGIVFVTRNIVLIMS